MKYFLSLFAILALAGAGCSQVPLDSSTDSQSDTVTEESTNSNDKTSVTETGNGQIEVQVGEGLSMIVEPKEGQTATDMVVETESEGEDDDVPVSEIVLGGQPDVTVNMESGNFFFSPSTIEAAPGDRILINFAENSGFHTFVIDELGVDYSIVEGESYTFTAPEEPGEYAYYCSIGSHRSFGMEGTLTIK